MAVPKKQKQHTTTDDNTTPTVIKMGAEIAPVLIPNPWRKPLPGLPELVTKSFFLLE
jgi:hypothetical protein